MWVDALRIILKLVQLVRSIFLNFLLSEIINYLPYSNFAILGILRIKPVVLKRKFLKGNKLPEFLHILQLVTRLSSNQHKNTEKRSRKIILPKAVIS